MGCKKDKETYDYNLYYVDTHDGIILEEYETEKSDTMELIAEMVDHILNNEKQNLSHKIEIQNIQLLGDLLQIDFSSSYGKLEKEEEILFRACVVKNFVQFPGISHVQITQDGNGIKDSKGNAIAAMNADSFLEYSGKDIMAYQYAKITLYFADETGTKLRKESRSVYYTSSSPLEKVVVEQLIKGPQAGKNMRTISENIKIISAVSSDDIAYVNLDQAFTSDVVPVEDEIQIYSIVNSLIDTCHVKEVQISVNGDNKLSFHDQVSLDQLFQRNKSIVQQGEME